MSQAEELLNGLEEPMTYPIDPNIEPHIVINSDRTITIPEELQHIAVQGDHNIETVTFDCPRYWDEHDFSQMSMCIVYQRPDGHREPHLVENLTIDESDSNLIHFDWTISGNVTPLKGNISFLVCAKLSNTEGIREREWHTRLNQDLIVDEGLDCSGDEIVEQNPDIIESILARLEIAEQGGVSDEVVAKAVEDYLIENPVQAGATTEQANQIEENRKNIEKKLDKSGLTPDKYLGTDAEGNVVVKDVPEGNGNSSPTSTITMGRFESAENSGVSISIKTVGADGSFSSETENVYDGKDGVTGATYIPKVTQIDATTLEFEFTPSPIDFGDPIKFTVELPDGSNQSVSDLTPEQITALDNMFKVCAFTKADVSAEYNAFKTAFGIEGEDTPVDPDEPDEPDDPEVTLSSISATYSGGDVPVGTAVTDLTGIVVTAYYSDSSQQTVTGYTLSGEIVEGENTITVSYGGKTATFIVNGVVESGGETWSEQLTLARTTISAPSKDNGFNIPVTENTGYRNACIAEPSEHTGGVLYVDMEPGAFTFQMCIVLQAEDGTRCGMNYTGLSTELNVTYENDVVELVADKDNAPFISNTSGGYPFSVPIPDGYHVLAVLRYINSTGHETQDDAITAFIAGDGITFTLKGA